MRNIIIVVCLLFPLASQAGIVQAIAGKETDSNSRPRVVLYQGKGVDSAQIKTRIKAGGSSYTVVRKVYDKVCMDELRNGDEEKQIDPNVCGYMTTASIENRKDTVVAGFTGLVKITNEETSIEIIATSGSAAGAVQISAQGEADALRLKTALEGASDFLTRVTPAGTVLDILDSEGDVLDTRLSD